MTRGRRSRRAALAAVGAVLLAVALALGVQQGASAQAAGAISGIIRPGAGSAVSVSGVAVQLIEVRDAPVVVQETRTAAGRFRFEVPIVATPATYLVRALVDDVTYLAPEAVQLTPQRPSAQVEVTVFAASSERPALKATISAVTIVAVDRQAGQITLQREDVVLNPTSRAWRGDSDGVTVLLPAPDRLISAEGQAWYDGVPAAGDFTPRMDGLAAVVPLRPGETLLITRFTVEADVASAALDLGLTAALPTDQMQIMAPERFVRRVLPLGEAVRGEPLTIEGESMRVVERLRPAQAGDVVAARLFGLAAPIPPHPLSGTTNALGGAVGAALIVAASAVLAVRRSPRARTVPA